MYKIIELDERKITQFKGKIFQVIDSAKREVVIGTDYLGTAITLHMWALTCLVEEK